MPASKPIASGNRAELAEVVITLTAARGLDPVSIRDVAAAADVSIETVQHTFATEDEMLAVAFRQVVNTALGRVAGVGLTGNTASDLSAVLRELLPLDARRLAEGRLYAAFAARAATEPSLRAIQVELTSELRAEVAAVLGPNRESQAAMLLAVVDGLILHEVTAPRSLPTAELIAALDRAIVAVV